MLLDSLLELVETLKQRIVEHKTALSRNEALTRYALIDPLLRELGWDTDNPSLVIPEYKTGDIEYGTGNSRADYALRSNESAVMIIEAKKLGSPLQPVLSKVLNYCQMEGVDHLAVTDGRHWEVFETHKKGNIHEKRIVSIDLVEDAPAEVCRKAFALWRPAATAGSLEVGEPPVVAQAASPTAMEAEVGSIRVTNEPWRPIASLNPGKGRKPPIQIRFPDDSIAKTPYWKSVLIENVRWLIESGKLSADRLPLKLPNSQLISDSRFDPVGKQMKRPVALGPYFLETNFSGSACVRNSILAIQHAGQDPAHFKVRFS